MFDKWLLVNSTEVAWVLFSTCLLFIAVIAFTRITGLRSFAKMSAPDFAMTIAVGSILGSAIVNPSPTIMQAAVGLAALFSIQWLIAFARIRIPKFSSAIDNTPVYLMLGTEILDDNLHAANVKRSDLYAKLREANVWNMKQVVSVVFETTGDISVLHRSVEETLSPDPEIFSDVRKDY